MSLQSALLDLHRIPDKCTLLLVPNVSATIWRALHALRGDPHEQDQLRARQFAREHEIQESCPDLGLHVREPELWIEWAAGIRRRRGGGGGAASVPARDPGLLGVPSDAGAAVREQPGDHARRARHDLVSGRALLPAESEEDGSKY